MNINYSKCQKQQQEIVELTKSIKNTKNTLSEINYIIKLADLYRRECNQVDKARFQYLTALQKSKKFQDSKVREQEFYILSKLVCISINSKDLKKAFKFCKFLRKIVTVNLNWHTYIKIKSDCLLATIYERFADEIFKQIDGEDQKYDRFQKKEKEILFTNYMDYSIKWMKKCVSNLEKIQESNDICYNDRAISIIHLKKKLLEKRKLLGDIYYTYAQFDDDYYENSMEVLLKVVQECDNSLNNAPSENLNFTEKMIINMKSCCLISLGRINYTISKYKKAESYFIKDQELCKQTNDKNGLILNYRNYALCLGERYNFEDALKYLKIRSTLIEKYVSDLSEKEDLQQDNSEMVSVIHENKRVYSEIDIKMKNLLGNFSTNNEKISKIRNDLQTYEEIIYILDKCHESNFKLYTGQDNFFLKVFNNSWNTIVDTLIDCTKKFKLDNKKNSNKPYEEYMNYILSYLIFKKDLKKYSIKVYERQINYYIEKRNHRQAFCNYMDYGCILDDINHGNLKEIEDKFHSALKLIRKYGNDEDCLLCLDNLEIIYRRRNMYDKIEQIMFKIKELLRTKNMQIVFLDAKDDEFIIGDEEEFSLLKKDRVDQDIGYLLDTNSENFQNDLSELENNALDFFNTQNKDISLIENDDQMSLIDDEEEFGYGVKDSLRKKQGNYLKLPKDKKSNFLSEEIETNTNQDIEISKKPEKNNVPSENKLDNSFSENNQNILRVTQGPGNSNQLDLHNKYLNDTMFLGILNNIFMNFRKKIESTLQDQNTNIMIEEDLTEDEISKKQIVALRTNNISFCKKIDFRGNTFNENVFQHLAKNEPFCCFLLQNIETIKFSGCKICIDKEFLNFMSKIVKFSKKSLIEIDISGLKFQDGDLADESARIFTKYINKLFVEFEQLNQINLSCLTIKDLWNLGGSLNEKNNSLKIIDLSKNVLSWKDILPLFLSKKKFDNQKIVDISHQLIDNNLASSNILSQEDNVLSQAIKEKYNLQDRGNFIETTELKCLKFGMNDLLLEKFVDCFPYSQEIENQLESDNSLLFKNRSDLVIIAQGFLDCNELDLSWNSFSITVDFQLCLIEINSWLNPKKINANLPYNFLNEKTTGPKIEVLSLRSMKQQNQSEQSQKKFGRLVISLSNQKTIDLRGNSFDKKYLLYENKIEYLT